MLSLFLDIYNFRVVDTAEILVASWDYNLMYGWSGFNMYYRPPDLGLSIEFMSVYLGTILCVIAINILKDIEKVENLSKYKPYMYANFFLLLLVGFVIIVFPAFYLFQNGLYYPIVEIYDESITSTCIYSVGIGYILQIFGFACVFPYVVFHYYTIRTFNIDSNGKDLQDRLEKENEPLDLDRYIAEEELKNKYHKIEKEKKYKLKAQILREGGL